MIQVHIGFSQKMNMKPLEELINTEEPGWDLVEDWLKEAKNEVEVLERNPMQADSALHRAQVTTRSPMGAIIYETGGILVDNGWIRILGSGSDKLDRSLPEWNKGKSFDDYGHAMPFVLIADDAIGGFFALNGGQFSNQNLGKVYYFSPDNLEWELLELGYSDFIYWTFTGNVEQFYKGVRWKDWKTEVKNMKTNEAVHFYPYLWTKYEDIEDLSRKAVPLEEIWTANFGGKN